jgi:hypothetical protein
MKKFFNAWFLISKSSKVYGMIWFLLAIFFMLSMVLFLVNSMFYAYDYDFRLEEARIIANKVSQGISFSTYLKPEVLNSDFDILEESNLDSKSFVNSNKYYFSVRIYDKDLLLKNYSIGNSDFLIECSLRGENFPVCVNRKFSLLDSKDSFKVYDIKILAASNMQGKNV